MKKSFLLAIVFLYSTLLFSQAELLIQNSNKGQYLLHQVSPKENFYSVGRLYHISAKEIAAYNGLDMSKGLTIGEQIKIPLTPLNFNQSSSKGRPIYYTVGEKEGLFRVSSKNNKVLMANLRKWNSLSTDNISPGQKLVVGYLVSPEANSIVVNNTGDIKKGPDHIEPPLKEKTDQALYPEKKETILPKKDQVSVPKEEVVEKKTKTTARTVADQSFMLDANGGYFRPQFEQQARSQSPKNDQAATAGIFKTASGWQDGKFYVLVDNVEPGTIVHIINPTNNKSIYAKVLGTMSGIRQNQGYDLRISNAGASALEIPDTEKFIIRLVY